MEEYRSTLGEGETYRKVYAQSSGELSTCQFRTQQSLFEIRFCLLFCKIEVSVGFCVFSPYNRVQGFLQRKTQSKMTATMQDSKPNNHIFLTPRVPQGLAAAVEGLTREVIRHRPENIYIFAAHHFEKLLRLREQYDDAPATKSNMKILHDMSEMIKERHGYLEPKDNTNNCAQNSGWSLNETAKVLERYRSIFGESNQKITTEEVRELANERVLATPKIPSSSPKKAKDRAGAESRNVTGKYAAASSSRRRESPRVETQDRRGGSKADSKTTPKIISQIPLAKDIKTELKKNRMSSRERKKSEEKKVQVACEYSKETIVEKSSRRTVEKTRRSYETRTEQRKSSRAEDTTRKRTEARESPKLKKSSRSVSMDQVKNYVVQNFVGMTSLEDLQTPSYVEKVQEVIDETSLVIKEKVEALKTGIAKASRPRNSRKDGSSSSEEQSRASAKSTGSDRQSAKSVDRAAEKEQTDAKRSDSSEGSNESKISLPAVRPPSSKSTSRSLSARSDPDGLVLPPISPESTKSPKVKEDLVLPILSPPRSSVASPDVPVSSIVADGKPAADANPEEEFQDSLNATPEPREPGQRPDSLDGSGRASPLETLKDKLLEIEEVQKRIEEVLDDTKANDEPRLEEEGASGAVSNIEVKLLEIQESERRIEKLLDPTAVDEPRTDIERKLKELEDAEKRIQNIFVSESDRETASETGAAVVELKADSSSSSPERAEGDGDGKESKPDVNLDKSRTASEREEKASLVPKDETRLLSPHSYILTEGSPCEIPDSVTTVIIPERLSTPDSDALDVEIENDKVCTSLLSSQELSKLVADDFSCETSASKIHDAFGEAVTDAVDAETSTVDHELMRGIKASHDMIVSRQDLALIQEEGDKEEAIDSEDEKVLKVVTSSLEEILDRSEVEYVTREEIESVVRGTSVEQTEAAGEIARTAEAVGENSLEMEEITSRSGESSNEVKETSLNTDRSSLSFDAAGPIVPELNLDSLPDLTISSFNITDDEQRNNQTGGKKSRSSDDTLSSERTKEISCSDGKKSPADEETANLGRISDEGERDDRGGAAVETDVATEKSTESVAEAIAESDVETAEYEKLEKILISSVAAEVEDEKKQRSSAKIGVDDGPAAADATETKAASARNAGAESAPDDINKLVCDDDDDDDGGGDGVENKQTIEQSPSPPQHRNDAAESSSTRNTAGVSRLDVVAQQLLVEYPSQCTDGLSIETDADESPSGNRSLDIGKQPDGEPVLVDVNKSEDDGLETSVQRSESSESSTFMSAATKIQAGVRGFLTRRRLQSTQRRSSTLDSVPSIQESFAVESSATAETRSAASSATTTLLMPIVESTCSSATDLRSRKKLRREDAVQRTTLSVENAFAENQLQHTGEFHDCIPLPLLDSASLLALRLARQRQQLQQQQQQQQSDSSTDSSVDAAATKEQLREAEAKMKEAEHLLGKILMEHAAAIPSPAAKLAPFVDVVLLPPPPPPGDHEAMLQNSYLNFITSVEDVMASELFPNPMMRPGTPKGVIIEEITSLDEIKSATAPPSVLSSELESTGKEASTETTTTTTTKPSEPDEPIDKPPAEDTSSVTTSEEHLSMNIDEVLGLGDEVARAGKPGSADALARSSSLSQDSRFSDERTRSPVTMMQIAAPRPGAEADKSEERLTAKEDSSAGAEEKEQESLGEGKSNDVA